MQVRCQRFGYRIGTAIAVAILAMRAKGNDWVLR
jgi:hypothetical protein